MVSAEQGLLHSLWQAECTGQDMWACEHLGILKMLKQEQHVSTVLCCCPSLSAKHTDASKTVEEKALFVSTNTGKLEL